MEYLLSLAHERYNILAQWPDFSAMFGKDYYYRCRRQPGVQGSSMQQQQVVQGVELGWGSGCAAGPVA